MHALRLVGFLLKREFNHAKRKKMKKKTLFVLESFQFVLFQSP